MKVLLVVFGLGLIGFGCALNCHVCTYQAGSDELPDVEGVAWTSQGSPQDTAACKGSDHEELNVATCDAQSTFCSIRYYTYNTTTYYQRGCSTACTPIAEVILTQGVEMTQLCCDGNNRCNHPSNDNMLLMGNFKEAGDALIQKYLQYESEGEGSEGSNNLHKEEYYAPEGAHAAESYASEGEHAVETNAEFPEEVRVGEGEGAGVSNTEGEVPVSNKDI